MANLDFIELNLKEVNDNIEKSFGSSKEINGKRPYLVAVSKLQPKEYIIKAYQCGQRHFGENYIQELCEKANDQELIKQCPDIKWHLIGHVQTNKINKLLSAKNLSVVETIDSIKLAESLNAHVGRHDQIKGNLDVFVQVNTSEEDVKSGISDENVAELVTFILNNCDRLNFVGLMTIGAYGYDTKLGPNPDFLKLLQVRDSVCQQLNLLKSTIELSMGMSSDYEHAISLGSSVVRVGTGIFGERKTKM